MNGYTNVFNRSIEQYEKNTDKQSLFTSFRKQYVIYGFIENGDREPDVEAINIAKSINLVLYNEYLKALENRKILGYDGSTSKYAMYNNLDSRHIMMSVLLFTYLPEDVKTIVEIGGGYGNWFYLNRNQSFNKWITIDLPHVGELQKWYLTGTEIETDRWTTISANNYMETFSQDQNNKKIDLLIGTHSLSEFSLEIFNDYYKNIICNTKYFLYCHHNMFPTLELITEKNNIIKKDFMLLKSVTNEYGRCTNCLYINKKNI